MIVYQKRITDTYDLFGALTDVVPMDWCVLSSFPFPAIIEFSCSRNLYILFVAHFGYEPLCDWVVKFTEFFVKFIKKSFKFIRDFFKSKIKIKINN